MWTVLDEIIVKVDGSLVGVLESGMSIKTLSRASFHRIHQIFKFFLVFRKAYTARNIECDGPDSCQYAHTRH